MALAPCNCGRPATVASMANGVLSGGGLFVIGYHAG